MATVLLIDDEIIFHHMIEHALKPYGFDTYSELTGKQGLDTARQMLPDVIITDINLPDISGYEVTRLLRRDPRFANTPIIVLTSQTGLQDKLSSFESGADDHINKPFEPEELVARMKVLLRRVETMGKMLPPGEEKPVKKAKFIAVHSLRGGIGTSTLAVNLAIGLVKLWEAPVMLLDLVLMAGQIALMLNMPLKRTWADLAGIKSSELDEDILRSISARHVSGLDFIAAPTYPSEAEMLSEDVLKTSISLISPSYDYIIADLPHDFSDISLQALDAADLILLMLAPELSSVRAAAAALDTYSRLGYSNDKVKLVLNYTFPRFGLPRERIENALNKPVTIALPYCPDVVIPSINLGRPIIQDQVDVQIAALMEDFAFYLSTNLHKKTRPEKPTQAWKRVYDRFLKSRKEKAKAS